MRIDLDVRAELVLDAALERLSDVVGRGQRHLTVDFEIDADNQLAAEIMHGDVVELSQGYGWWWMYIGHFIHAPFYCYAYAFGELLVLALFQKYKEDGARFVPAYLDLLGAGGSDSPPALLAKLGADINDPQFWDLGLRLLAGMVSEAEELASKI